jgi:hypothetical protein
MSKRAKQTKSVKKNSPARSITKVVKKNNPLVRPATVKKIKKTVARPRKAPIQPTSSVEAIPTIVPSVTRVQEDTSIISSDVLNAFFQKRTGYYSLRWERYRQKRFPGWNWAACLMGPWWFFYRRMPWYGLGFLIMGLIVFIPKIGAFALGVNILLGFLGNELYLSEFKHTYLAKASGVDSVDPAYWSKVGGVKNWALVLMGIVYFIAAAGIALIFRLAINEVSIENKNVFSSHQQEILLPPRPTGQSGVAPTSGNACMPSEGRPSELGEPWSSKGSCTLGSEENPKLASALYKRGAVSAQRGNWVQAEADFKRALELDPALKGQVDKIMEQKK